MAIRLSEQVAYDRAMISIVGAVSRVVGVQEALALLELIRYPENRSRVLTDLAIELAHAAIWDGYEHIIDLIAAQGENWKELFQIWGQLGAEDALSASLDTVAGIADDSLRRAVLDELIEAMAQAGSLEGLGRALETAAQMQDKAEKSRVLNGVALAFARAGDRDQAAAVAKESVALSAAAISTDPEHFRGYWGVLIDADVKFSNNAWTLVKRAQSLALAGEVDESFTVAAGLAGFQDFYRAEALQHIAWACAYLKDKESLGRIFAEVEAIQYVPSRVRLLSELVRIMALLGDLVAQKSVIALLKATKDSGGKAVALGGAALALDRLGEHEDALSVLQSAFTIAGDAGCQAIYDVLENAAPFLAGVNDGQALWDAYEAFMEIEGWWDGRVVLQ